ncbi:MAG: tRNA pseudouridine(13) synthase TruD [Nanoarchaeota archaeon]|nr:tRNA pseudouridine(13) synthase TruD [Nanoarchaeota archaeon]
MILKQLPEDFIVKEIYQPVLQAQGPYICFLLKKKEWGTIEALGTLARALKIDVRSLGIAGMKDKRGITEQYVSAHHVTKEQLERITIKNITLTFLGYLEERITLGQLEGNHFDIIARDIKEQITIDPNKKILNLFDYQRFGKDEANIDIGRNLLQGNYQKVCEHLNLQAKGNDYLGTLRTVNRRVLRFLLSSYQSYLWNSAVQQLKEYYSTVPVLGFLTELNGEIGETYQTLLKKEGITQEHFQMRSFPELASEGNERKMYVDITNLTWEWAKDNHHNNWKCTLHFDLGKGQYATHTVKTLLS